MKWFQTGAGQWMRVTRRWTLKVAPIRTGWWLAEIYDPDAKLTVECMTFQSADASRNWADEAAPQILKRAAPENKRGSWWQDGA